MKKVLVVDDSETIRLQVGRALETAGFSVVQASDGVEGLERAEENELNLLLLDINMPRMGGLEMLEQLRQRPRMKNVPVLVLTTEAQQTLIARARQAGASGWIMKPVKMELLVDTVAKLAS